MMRLLRAEWRKVTGNRCLVGCTVWIWPVLALLMLGIFIFALIVSSEGRQSYMADPPAWNIFGLLPWVLLNEQVGIFRLLIVAFAAAIFASEYSNATWKAVLPGNRRWRVMVAKYIALSVFVMVALAVMMLVILVGFGLLNAYMGVGYPPALTTENILDFLEKMALNMALTYTTVLILSGVAAFSAIVSRSTIFAVGVAIFFSLLESIGSQIAVSVAVQLLGVTDFGYAYLATPTYNIGNILSFLNSDEALTILDGGLHLSLAQSVGLLAMWVVVLVGGSIFSFTRQDIA